MFVAQDECLDVGFGAAHVRLANLLHGGALATSSADCYEQGVTGLARPGPPGSIPCISKLVEVQFGELVVREDSAAVPFRWHVTRPGGGLFPVLDADLRLAALSADATMLGLAGAYRAPLGKPGAALDRAVLRRVATETIQAFVRRVADAIVHPASAPAPGRESHDPIPRQPPAPEMS